MSKSTISAIATASFFAFINTKISLHLSFFSPRISSGTHPQPDMTNTDFDSYNIVLFIV